VKVERKMKKSNKGKEVKKYSRGTVTPRGKYVIFKSGSSIIGLAGQNQDPALRQGEERLLFAYPKLQRNDYKLK
jgi:hypothetical protein